MITLDSERCIHFIEVKAWKADSIRHPLESFNRQKVHKIKMAARQFLEEYCRNGETDIDSVCVSFDLLWVESGKIREFFEALL